MTNNLLETRRAEFGRLARTQRLTLHGLGVLAFLVGVSALVGSVSRGIPDAPGAPYTGTATLSRLEPIRERLDAVRGSTELASLLEDRESSIQSLAERYGTGRELTTTIFDAAVSAGIHPELAFRLVQAESNFNPRARSTANALGLAQVQLATARAYEPRITEAQLFEPARNLRIGLQYLRDLDERFGDNMRLALLAYNVGPAKLAGILEGGRNPAGGYAATVLGGLSFKAKSD